MKKEEERREFAMSFAELEQFVRNVISSMRRDSAEFANYGVDAGDIDDFENLCNDFEDLPTDAELEGIVTIKTQAKDAKADELQVKTREITTRVEVKFGENSGQYRSLDAGDLTRFSDPSLLRCARRVHRRGTDMLADLASEGLTQQILDDYDVLIQGFEDALDDKDDAVKDRDIATNNRVQKANELYGFLTKYCNYGKRIWVNTNEAKYNDYVIYRTPQELPGKVLNLAFDHLAATFSWDASPHSETYRLVFRAQGSSDSWTAAYVGPNTSAPYSFDDGDWEIRCRGINSEGKGPWSDLLNITVGLPIPQNVTTYLGPSPDTLVYVNWDGPIPGASRVNVYKSIVPIGDPPGEYIVAGEWSQAPPYYEASTPGVRYYFYCTAYAHYYESPPSEVVFVDS